MSLVSIRLPVEHCNEYLTMNITAGGCCTIPRGQTSNGRTVRQFSTRDNMNVKDIEGATPFNRILHITKKPDLYNVDDIAGTRSIRLHRGLNTGDKDIVSRDPEEKFRRRRNFITSRHTNPLNPDYKLPTFTVQPVPEQRFVRDSFNVNDIEGARACALFKFKQRENFLVDDIIGTKPGWKPRHARIRLEKPPLYNSLNVKDITDEGFKTQRCTNPLTPEYRCYGRILADDPIDIHPRKLHQQKNYPFFSLTTEDIDGAKSGWTPPTQLQPPIESRRHFRNINYIGDITGAQANTLKRCMHTERHINPLNPIYRNLDGELLEGPSNLKLKNKFFTLDSEICAEKACKNLDQNSQELLNMNSVEKNELILKFTEQLKIAESSNCHNDRKDNYLLEKSMTNDTNENRTFINDKNIEKMDSNRCIAKISAADKIRIDSISIASPTFSAKNTEMLRTNGLKCKSLTSNMSCSDYSIKSSTLRHQRKNSIYFDQSQSPKTCTDFSISNSENTEKSHLNLQTYRNTLSAGPQNSSHSSGNTSSTINNRTSRRVECSSAPSKNLTLKDDGNCYNRKNTNCITSSERRKAKEQAYDIISVRDLQ